MLDVVLPVVQVLLSAILVVLVLMHSGRDTGFGGMGFTPASQGGQHVVERNLTRLTLVVAALFGINTVALFYVLNTGDRGDEADLLATAEARVHALVLADVDPVHVDVHELP